VNTELTVHSPSFHVIKNAQGEIVAMVAKGSAQAMVVAEALELFENMPCDDAEDIMEKGNIFSRLISGGLQRLGACCAARRYLNTIPERGRHREYVEVRRLLDSAIGQAQGEDPKKGAPKG
jgi:hypothetical protein